MAVAVDNTGQKATGLAVSTLTIGSFVVGAGSNRCIYLGVSQYNNPDRAPTATFNTSENFTVHDAQTVAEGGGTRRVTILKLVNPTNATADIVVSWGGSVGEVVAGATSWTGVDQTTPFGTAVKTSGTGGSPSINLSGATGDVNHDTISADAGGSLSLTGNQTLRWRDFSAASTTEGAGQSAAGTGSAVAMTWTMPAGGIYALAGVAIAQSGGGGGTFGRLVGGTLAGGLLVGGILTG